MNGLAVARISEEFATQINEELNLENLTWEKLVQAITDAEENDTLDQLNDQILANVLEPILQGLLAPQPNEGGTQ